jgi:hypothetical protein
MQHRFYMQHPQVAALAQQQGEGKSHIIETTVEAIFQIVLKFNIIKLLIHLFIRGLVTFPFV